MDIPVILSESEIYFRLVWWLFVPFITILLLLLCYLYLTMQKVRRQEYLSLAFSHHAINGLEAERRRISRELHDIVLPQVQDKSLSNAIRSICMELNPPDFSILSIKDSLAELCGKFTQRTGIKCACSMEKELSFASISAENQLHLYRMVQESLNNIEKHSQSNTAALVVRYYTKNKTHSSDNKSILICISDDGQGLRSQPGTGLGMMNMRQRAYIAGATLDFISESGNGLMVRIEIPLDNQE